LETIIVGSVIKIETLLLKQAALNPKQYENLRLKFRGLNRIWQLNDLDKFIKDLYVFMLTNLQTGDFEIWMDAFKILCRNNYPSKELKGFLISIDTSKSIKLDFTKVEQLKYFLLHFSGLKNQEAQPVFQSK